LIRSGASQTVPASVIRTNSVMFSPTPPPTGHPETLAVALLRDLRPALEREDRARTVAIVRQLLALSPALGGQWAPLAQVAAENGELTLARAALARFVAASGRSAEARYERAGFLAHFGLWVEADAALEEVPPTVPDPGANAHSRGTAALHLGRSEEARAHLERALTHRPLSGPTWLSLATLVDLAKDEDLAERIVAAERAMAAAAPGDRATFGYALGRARHARGEIDAAFATFAAGAALLRQGQRYDREADRRLAAEVVRGLDSATVADIAGLDNVDTSRAIIVTGLPRSGTTLVEQVLTSHSAVSDGGEINRLSLLRKDIGGVSGDAISEHARRGGARWAGELWNHWLAERFGPAGRVVDKTIHNTRLLGLAAALLPQAPLVWVRRDPLDCAWSCFSTWFAGTQAWTNDLADIAWHFRLEDAVLARWREVLGERVLVIDYEHFVGDPGRAIPALLAHCGLPPEDAPLAPHRNPRPVATASAVQVRRPISTASVGAAERYRGHLAPFLAAYDAPSVPLDLG